MRLLLSTPPLILTRSSSTAAAPHRRERHPISRLALAITSCLLLILSSSSAAALEPNLDFNIADEASYQSFKEAVSKAEYVRNAYIQDSKPRVIGAVAGLVHYATLNPLASETQLATFLAEYDAKLAGHAPGGADADLQRGSHLVSAVRFELPLSGVMSLEGTNTNLGEEIAIFLGIDVPPPTGFESNKRRSVRFEQARLRALSESPAWANLLTIGFSGQDLLGHPNPKLAGVLQTYLEGEGYSPFVPACPGGGCTDSVGDALATLPASYAAYDLLLGDPFGTDGIWDTVVAGFAAVNLESVNRVQELTDILANAPPSLVEAVANAHDPTFVTQRQDEYLANLAKVANQRAVINVNAMLLAQSPDDGTRAIGDKAQRFASIQLSQNKGWAAAAGGVRMLGGVATLAFEYSKGKKRDPVKLLGGAVNAVTGALGLGEVFGADVDELAAEQEILDQIIEMRVQLVEVQLQLNDRFDRIETQLNVVFLELIGNFAELSTQVGALGDTLDVLEHRMAQANAKLDRIEDALWAILESNLEGQLAFETNVSLAYRETVGFDFPYDGPKPSFFAVNSDMFTYATTLAVGAWAGDDPTNILTVADAASLLNDPNIGRQLNDLRVFPTQLGLPAPLFSERVPAPSLWTQSASVYAQIARENPWYFANQYENELQLGGLSDLDNIISKGEDLDELALNARDPQLFDAIFDAWGTELATMASVINTFAFDTPAVLDSVAATYTAVAISGDYAFVSELLYGLRVIDISDPANLSIVGNLPGIIFADIAISGDYAFVAAFNDGLQVIDISDPTAPFIVVNSSFPTTGSAVGVTISGPLAYVSTDSGRVHLFSVFGFFGAGFVDMPNSVNSVVASGDYAFVGVKNVGMQVIDISDPFSPFIVVGATVNNSTLGAFNVAVSGDLAFMTDGNAGLQVIDISDPTAPFLIDTVATGFTAQVRTSGDLVFAGAGFDGMSVVSASDQTGPFFVVGTVDAVTPPGTPGGLGGYTTDIAISGNLAFMTDYYAGLVVIELSDAQDWQDVLDELPTIEVGGIYLSESLLGYQKLIDAYITLGMPELMEESPIVRAALRSDATKGELAVGPVDQIISGYISNPDVTPLTWSQVPANLQLLRDEVDAVIGNESVGHGYVDYMLAELEHLKDNARKLAIDDTYYTPFGVPLTVVAVPAPMAPPLSGFDTGLLANDVYQRLRDIQVDLLFDQEPEYVAPQNGSVTLGAEGSFVYTPDPGFSGLDSFTYRTFSDMADPAAPTFADCDSSLITACSEPATVVIIVQELLVVQNTNDAGAGSLRDAITNALGGALIRFDAALDDQPILLSNQLNLTQDVTIDASTLPNGLTLDGGGITRVLHVDSGVVATLTGLTITGGSGDNGGGIENAGGILNLVDVSLIANNSAFYGGGIINFGGIVTATNTTIAGNVAGFGGGGLYNGNSAATVSTLINSTVEGNTSNGSGGGGGIQNVLGAVNVIHTTIVGNDSSASSGGGIQNGGGTLTVENSIVAGNAAATIAADFFSNTTVLTDGQSLIGDHEGVQAEFPIGPFAGTAANPVDPMLGLLADNGGPTLTMLPLFGSPAIDTAVTGANSPISDQRGTLRPQGPNDDIGSVEVVPEPGSAMGMISGAVFLALLSRRRPVDLLPYPR